MFNLTLSVLITASIALLISYWLLQKKHRQEQFKMHKEYIQRINRIKTTYKANLEQHSLQQVIRPNNVRHFYAIIDNFFIHQPVNEQSVRMLEKLANAITITIAREFNLTKGTDDIEWLQKKLLNFAIRLPDHNREYNRTFYQGTLRAMLKGLNATRNAFVQSTAV